MKNDLDDPFNAPPPPPTVRATRDDILDSLRWGEPIETPTKKGPRLRTVAKATPAAIQLFDREGSDLYALGYTLSEWPKGSGKWSVTKWSLLPEKIIVERKNAIEASRATDATINAPHPEGLDYLGYQRAGIAFGYERRSTLIADEMGLGKTIQAIGLLNCWADAKRILIICPASLKLNWRREILKWQTIKRHVFIADSKFLPDIDGIVIINYDVLHKHEDAIKGTEWDALIVDECHLLKNKKARRSKMVLGLEATRKEKAKGMADIPGIEAARKVFLTGTPISNGKPKEIWPLIHYLDPINWSSFWKFAPRYCGAGDHNGWNCDGATNLHELQEKLRATIMIRRLKKDVLKDLPPKTRKVVEIQPDDEAREALAAEREVFDEDAEAQLEAQVELAKASENEEAYKAAVNSLSARIKSKSEDLFTLRKNTAIAKARMPAVMEMLEDAVESSEKVIIFIHHKEVGRIISERFGSAAVMIVGDTPMQERDQNASRFQKDPTCKVIIGSIGSMGTGWTLTAASHVIMFELDWVPGNVSQCEDRAHRIGQTDNVLVEHYVLEGSLDGDMAKRIVDKQDAIDKALDRDKPIAQVELQAPASPRGAGSGETFGSLAAIAATMTLDQRAAAIEAIRIIHGYCDGAARLDGAGFSKIDVAIGRSLAEQQHHSAKQCALARKIALKYTRQLPLALTTRMKGTTQ